MARITSTFSISVLTIALFAFVALVATASICVFGTERAPHSGTPWKLILLWFVASGGIYEAVYLALFGYVFAMGDAGSKIPKLLLAFVEILGFPMMLLLRLPITYFAPHGRWWGDDSNFIMGLAFLNGVIWASGITSIYIYWTRRKRRQVLARP